MFDFLNNAKFDSDLMELVVAPAGIHLVRALSKFKIKKLLKYFR